MPSPRARSEQVDSTAEALVSVLPVLNRVLERQVALDFPHPGLPEGQLALLRLVEEHVGITVREAAEVLLMKPNNVSALVSQLTEKGLLERRQDADDKRVAHLHPTPLAASRLAEARAIKTAHLTRLLATLTDGEQDALGSALGALNSLARRPHSAG
ncbi:MarR family winged helix-turn-helix transcriptional regulator [Kitasatospora phosalacinea]|uniref:MarR family winged helix-turn-helix transcriptional regulator n=1 Tax=Kitasatospora phosalacinea TaxID=2065 RepID=UPI00052517AE|nr:MarR family transcriptional regulator [Kitasatospora phosalacinea]